MKNVRTSINNLSLPLLLSVLLTFNTCMQQNKKGALTFKSYSGIKLGFSTQNFLKALPLNVDGLTEIIEYASKEGYQFIEIRDQFVDLTLDDCKALAQIAKEKNLEVIYVFNKNPLDSTYFEFFERALENILAFPGPGILRAMASKSEFDRDPMKKGWTREELTKLAEISDSCGLICKAKNIRFVFENSIEAFFGDSLSYFGLADLFTSTTNTGLQLDIANLFRNTARVQADAEKVLEFLPTMGSRWVETHLKTIRQGEPQTVLTENPIPVEKILELMDKQKVVYAALELTAVEDKQQCIDNHASSIQFLRDKGILKK